MAAHLRVGLALSAPDAAGGFERTFGLADHAEALGLDSLWVPEGHFRPGATPSPLVTLAALAARTHTIRLATSSLLLSVRDPLRTAASAASVDVLSNGRLVLGLGRGFDPRLFLAHGLAPGEKRTRFDRALDAMLDAWARSDGLLPVQRPHPPLLVAAFGRKGLRQAARRGLPYLASPLEPLARLVENHEIHRRRLPAHIDPRTLPVCVMRTVHVAGSPVEAERVREALRREAAALAARLSSTLARAADGPPEERALVGSASEVAAQLGGWRERLGIELLVVRPAPGASDALVRASLERLVTEVVPALGEAGADAG